MECGGKGVDQTHHGEVVVSAHRVDVEGAPQVLGLLVVLVTDVPVAQLRVERLVGWVVVAARPSSPNCPYTRTGTPPSARVAGTPAPQPRGISWRDA